MREVSDVNSFSRCILFYSCCTWDRLTQTLREVRKLCIFSWNANFNFCITLSYQYEAKQLSRRFICNGKPFFFCLFLQHYSSYSSSLNRIALRLQINNLSRRIVVKNCQSAFHWPRTLGHTLCWLHSILSSEIDSEAGDYEWEVL